MREFEAIIETLGPDVRIFLKFAGPNPYDGRRQPKTGMYEIVGLAASNQVAAPNPPANVESLCLK
ncbi:MAG: hypothetical protein AAFR27_05740 [Pseudomonadota bacterium]